VGWGSLRKPSYRRSRCSTDCVPANSRIPQFEGTRLDERRTGLDLKVIPPERWEELFPHWEELSQTSVEPIVFLSPFWIAAWWRHFSEERQPCMLAAWEAGCLCGLAPFYLRRMSLPGAKRG